jgi:hypothetical protein
MLETPFLGFFLSFFIPFRFRDQAFGGNASALRNTDFFFSREKKKSLPGDASKNRRIKKTLFKKKGKKKNPTTKKDDQQATRLSPEKKYFSFFFFSEAERLNDWRKAWARERFFFFSPKVQSTPLFFPAKEGR